MGLLTKMFGCVDVLLGAEDSPITPDKPEIDLHAENYEKGVAFEKHVIGLFDPDYFALHDWTRDMSGKTDGYRIESDANPDLVMRYKPTDTLIAVECKFRSSLYRGMLNWTTPRKLRGYQAYAKRTGITTFVVVGLGGTPSAPERMFCVPLAEAEYPRWYPCIFEKFERLPAKNLFWTGVTLE